MTYPCLTTPPDPPTATAVSNLSFLEEREGDFSRRLSRRLLLRRLLFESLLAFDDDRLDRSDFSVLDDRSDFFEVLCVHI